jgi:nucleotide-binding universal stress UspA family protein
MEMSYKTIQVYADDGRHSEQRIQIAETLAANQGAHIQGMHVIPPLSYPSYMAAEIPIDLIEQRHAQLRAVAASLGTDFAASAERAGLNQEWRCFDAFRGDLTETVAELGRYADINIVSQSDPDGEGQERLDLVEPLLFGSGRPVLVVPYAGKFDGKFENVMIAWNATRESARAVFDAMPILQAARKVTVMTVNPSDTAEAGDPYPGADLANILARHDVQAEVHHTQGDDISVGDMLLSTMAETATDLLVMGAYGHSRMREYVFGGATRHIIQHMTAPVMMSH